MLQVYYVTAYCSTKEGLVIRKNPPHGAYCESALAEVRSACPAHGTAYCSVERGAYALDSSALALRTPALHTRGGDE